MLLYFPKIPLRDGTVRTTYSFEHAAPDRSLELNDTVGRECIRSYVPRCLCLHWFKQLTVRSDEQTAREIWHKPLLLERNESKQTEPGLWLIDVWFVVRFAAEIVARQDVDVEFAVDIGKLVVVGQSLLLVRSVGSRPLEHFHDHAMVRDWLPRRTVSALFVVEDAMIGIQPPAVLDHVRVKRSPFRICNGTVRIGRRLPACDGFPFCPLQVDRGGRPAGVDDFRFA